MENDTLPVISIEYYDFRDLLSDKYSRKDTPRIVELLSPPKELIAKVPNKRNLCYPIHQDKDGVFWISVTDILLPNEYKKLVYRKMGRKIKKICSDSIIVGARILMTIISLCKIQNFNEFIYDGGPDDPDISITGFIAAQVMKCNMFKYENPRYDPNTGDLRMKCNVVEDLSSWPTIKDFATVELKRLDDRTEDE